MKKRLDIIILGLVGMGFILLIAIYGAIHIDQAPVFQLVIYSGILVITMFYVYYTGKIVNATKEQADASVKMAKTMTKPRLIPSFWFASDFDSDRYVRFTAWVHNDGNGPAYDVEFRIEDDSTPPNILLTTSRVSVVRGHDSEEWRVPNPRLQFQKSDKVQRRFIAIKYRDVDGEHEIRQSFVMQTVADNRPFAHLESVSKRTLSKRSLEDELP